MLDLMNAFNTFPILETTRLRLREISEVDADDMFRIMSDPEVMHYFGMLPMTARAQAVQRAHWSQEAFAEREGIRWAIVERSSGRFLGTCGYWRIVKEHDRAEIGYELAPAAWGRGIMTEALGVVLDFGFLAMRLHSVEAQIHPDNAGSRRVLEKLGFEREGYFRENFYDPVEGRYTDTAVYSLIKPDWLKRTPGGA